MKRGRLTFKDLQLPNLSHMEDRIIYQSEKTLYYDSMEAES